MAVAEQSEPAGLRRELRFWEALALSVGIASPTLAMGANPPLAAASVGRNVALAFLIAAVGVALVAYGFVQLTRRFNHAGSVYGLAGLTLGPRAGFFGGFALMGVYLVFAIALAAAAGVFIASFLDSAGIWEGAPGQWFPIALVAAVAAWFVSSRDVRLVTRFLLSMEALGVLMIVALVAVVLGRTIGGEGPAGQEFDAAGLFWPTDGVSWGAIAGASVIGFLSFAGFEAAASLGEETDDPTRNVPRALVGSVALLAALYLLTVLAQSVGFGGNVTETLGASTAPLGDLAREYVGSWLASAIDLAAAASSFAGLTSCLAAFSRIAFALARDGFGPSALARTNDVGAPAIALGVALVVSLVAVAAARLNGTEGIDVYYYFATLGVVALLLVYGVTSLGAMRVLARSGGQLLGVAASALGALYLLYVLYKNLFPEGATSPYDVIPWISFAWCILGAVIALAAPGLARRIGANLARDEAPHRERS